MSVSFSPTDFLRGALGGATGLLLSHPIDTIKSNIQYGKPIKWDLKSLYRGVVPPLFGVGLEKAIVFGTYENTQRLLNAKYDSDHKNKKIIRGISGATAGLMASFIVTPVERLKILRQTNEKFVLRDLNPRFLYRGLSSTFTREMPGFAIYFSVYEEMKEYFGQNMRLNTFHHFVFGGISGSISWLFIYPQDLVKTRVQASKKDITPRQVIKSVFKEHGIRGFFRGFHLALMRAVPLHAGTFAMVEYLKSNHLKDKM